MANPLSLEGLSCSTCMYEVASAQDGRASALSGKNWQSRSQGSWAGFSELSPGLFAKRLKKKKKSSLFHEPLEMGKALMGHNPIPSTKNP